MTRVKGTLKDKGHYARKTLGYTVLVLMFVPYILCRIGGLVADWLDETVVFKMHKFMKPCLYARKNPGRTP